jgi:2-C-methyl-D-erythritol 2,4-cyclodiphosphate synthase
LNLRVGFGYDIHRLVEGRPLFLAGIEIPFSKGLLGHSDGDAAVHALADALLSASGLGDLGQHFPPHDPQWAGVSGIRLLEETRRLLRTRGARIQQADLTIVAEEPMLFPHRATMARVVAAALGCNPSVINIKGRTNEGLDAIGRGEAIAAYAVALIRVEGP